MMASKPVDLILSKLDGVAREGWGHRARCPVHGGRSLGVSEGDDGHVLLNCFLGCDPADILAAIGLQRADLFPSKPSENGHAPAFDAKPQKPATLAVIPAAIPAELRALGQWVMWKWEYRLGEKKPWTKPPFQTDGRQAKSTDPATWTTWATAWAAYQTGKFDGVGFAVHAGDPYTVIDLDSCRDPDAGTIAAWAREIVEAVPTYWEVSPSGTGLRGICRAVLPPGRRRTGDIEMYSDGRYITVTGHVLGVLNG